MISFDSGDIAIAAGGVIALVITFIFWKRDMRKFKSTDFNMLEHFPPPGSTPGEVREWRRWQRELKINEQYPLTSIYHEH